jgi:uncharacterized protein YdaT
MTPKEKAIELYNKMYETGFKPRNALIRTEQAKECALIAVDEIIKSNAMLPPNLNWQEVKKEIELL